MNRSSNPSRATRSRLRQEAPPPFVHRARVVEADVVEPERPQARDAAERSEQLGQAGQLRARKDVALHPVLAAAVGPAEVLLGDGDRLQQGGAVWGEQPIAGREECVVVGQPDGLEHLDAARSC